MPVRGPVGLVALAADAPEVTAPPAIAAPQRLGAGVVIGSKVFNLAALRDWAPSSRAASACIAGSWSRAGAVPEGEPELEGVARHGRRQCADGGAASELAAGSWYRRS